MRSDKRPILHIITRLEPGGSARNTLDSAAAQSSDREVVVVTGPYAGKTRLEPDKRVRQVELPGLRREISPLNDIRTFFSIRKIISGLEPAIVHTHTAKAGILGRWAARLVLPRAGRVRPVIVHTPHGHVFYGYFGPLKTFIFLLAERLTAPITDHFIALTEGERRESLERGIGSPETWTVIHSGVSLDPLPGESARRELGIAEGETVIATAARLEPVKGVEFFIRAAAKLREARPGLKLRFLVIGDGSLRAELELLAGELGLGGYVMFAGFRHDMIHCLSAADIYVQTSLNEGMGRTAIEAQYAGLPVVASRVCGLPDVVEEGITGLLAPPGDPPALAKAVEALLDDAELRLRMGKAAKESVLKKDSTGFSRFSAESMNAKLKSFYNSVLPG